MNFEEYMKNAEEHETARAISRYREFLTKHSDKSPLEFKLDFRPDNESISENPIVGDFYKDDMLYVQYGYFLDRKTQDKLSSRLREELLLPTIVAAYTDAVDSTLSDKEYSINEILEYVERNEFVQARGLIEVVCGLTSETEVIGKRHFERASKLLN